MDIGLPPTELPLDLANLPVTGAHTLDLLRGGPKGRIVGRVQLTVGAEPTPHGEHPDLTDEAIAEALWTMATKDCESLKREHCKYVVKATYTKGRSGPAPEPKSFELTVGDPSATSEREQRLDLIAEMRNERRVMFEQVVASAGAIAKLAQAFTGMVSSVSEALGSLATREREAAQGGLEKQILDNERESERERMRLFQSVAVPLLGKIAGATGGGESATPSAETPRIVKLVRDFGATLTSEQLAFAARTFGANRLVESTSLTSEGEAYDLIAWMYAQPSEKLIALYNQLRDDQVAPAMALQQAAASTPPVARS